ncbi:hypothetical protein MPTK1_3g15690 [Marchantia polymorpha subsp. ruderalis]|uniref:Uncharacterized protein n=2 Tax=Marchantia polymorpha TaxID=3197 RepID=A0AAF6B166_MARPO|nr:hypothetical protein MARPO_0004s0103 [Marchantia polymorpha]BBN05750.1 hypothetical protein Mp_3g15690 [Marchantia polymorpha subsp. ruderalis]|eukprot:PTQ48829.1 hypothetical protein MARPO_0004s0103 [Marchantia polymorpha]
MQIMLPGWNCRDALGRVKCLSAPCPGRETVSRSDSRLSGARDRADTELLLRENGSWELIVVLDSHKLLLVLMERWEGEPEGREMRAKAVHERTSVGCL